MPRAAETTEIAEISQIFLSATAQDCRQYREAVRDFVQDNEIAAKIFLQENWAEGGDFVVDVCERRVKTCDAYIGLFGYRYGWTPPGFTKSITELEFRWAVDRWRQPVPPIFVLLPEKGSEADSQLREWARPYLEQEFPDEVSLAKGVSAQQAFLASVVEWASDGRILVYYRTPLQLVGKALSCIQHWNQRLLRQALAGRREALGDIPAEDLGRVGREDQRAALSGALEAFRDRQGQRAIAFLVHGPENHGQREFAEFLYRWDDEWEDVAVHCGQPSAPDSIDSLICWTCGQLQEPVLGAASVDALAAVLAARLARGSVVFVLRTSGRQAQRLLTFQNAFWEPLLAALAGRSPAGSGRLYWFVIDHQELPADPGPHIRSARLAGDDGDAVDYRQLLALPALGDIGAAQVRRWLKELKATAGVSLSEDRRREIAERVTQPDGKPANVYDRLTREGFWASAT
ncbi:MAG TPA: DUF4062 domain-containing protein [Accumulibacter sp.]|nr:DUF4062 domain-containing protein [Accumulibacter sp.]